MLPLHLQSFGGVTRVWPFGELRIPLLHALPAPSHLPHSKYDIARTYVNNSDLQNLDSLDFFLSSSIDELTIDNSEEFVRRLRSFRLKRFEFYANFAKLKRRLRSFHLKCFEVYTNFAKLSTLLWLRSLRLKRSEAYAKFAKLSTPIRNFTVCNSKCFEST